MLNNVWIGKCDMYLYFVSVSGPKLTIYHTGKGYLKCMNVSANVLTVC